MKTVFSTDGENFNYDDLSEAAGDHLINIGEISVIYKGEAVKNKASHYFKRKHLIIEEIEDSVFEEIGESSQSWINTDKDGLDYLNKLIKESIDKWADKFNSQPDFFSVENVTEIKVKLIDEDGNYEVVE